MESYGELLKEARIQKNLTIQDVKQITAIEADYIQALEEEQEDAFPSESYFLGFLSNYCDALGIDRQKIYNLYRAKKIQEAPPPLILTQRKKPRFLVPLIVTLVVLVLAGTGAYLYFGVFDVPERLAEAAPREAARETTHEYEFTGEPVTRRLYRGDQIIVPGGEGGNIVLTVGGTLGRLELLTPTGNQIIELSEERAIDIDGDGEADLIFYLGDVSNTNEANGAEVRILEAVPGSLINVAQTELERTDIPDAGSLDNAESRINIHEDTRAYPFTVNITFRESCLLRYQSDDDPYVENFYRGGDTISITSSNGTRLWMSNFAAVNISVQAGYSSYNLDVGRDGEVQAESIRWMRDRDGRYRIVVLELD